MFDISIFEVDDSVPILQSLLSRSVIVDMFLATITVEVSEEAVLSVAGGIDHCTAWRLHQLLVAPIIQVCFVSEQ